MSESRAHARPQRGPTPSEQILGGHLNFQHLRLLVLGDLMLDSYIAGEVHRISPEAPVPVLHVTHERGTPGGGGNVALNLAGLGVQTFVAGVIGPDTAGKSLLRLLEDHAVDTRGVLIESSRPTTCKTRVLCGGHQLVRFDRESTADLSPETERQLEEQFLRLLELQPHGVLLSDYAKGVLSAPLLRFVLAECGKRCIPTFVDPKKDDYRLYAGATCLTPNWKEFQSAARFLAPAGADSLEAGSLLREQAQLSMLLVTQGAQGMTLITGAGLYHLPALAQEVFDVSGAGDTVVSTFAAACCAGLSPLAALEISNSAASVVVRKIGTAPILWTELKQALAAVHEPDGQSTPLAAALSTGAALALS